MKACWIIALMLGVLALPAWCCAEVRVWSAGNFKIKAELVEVADGKAVLRRDDDKLVTVDVERLSEVDQEYLKTAKLPKKEAKAAPAEEEMPEENDEDSFGQVEGQPPPEILSADSGGKGMTKSSAKEGSSSKGSSKGGEATTEDANKPVKISYDDPYFTGVVRILKPGEEGSSWNASVCFSPNGGRLAVGGAGEAVTLYDVNQGKFLSQARLTDENHSDTVTALVFTPDGKRILAGTEKGRINIFKVGSSGQLTVVARYLGHDGKVNTISSTPDSKFGVSGGDDKTFRLWRITDGGEIRVFTGFKDEVCCSWISEDGSRAIGSDGKVAAMYDLPQKRFVKSMTISKGYGDIKVSISPSGTYMAAKDWDKLAIIEVKTGNPFPLSEKFSFGRFPPIFSKDGKTLAVAGSDLDLWDWRNGRKLQSFDESSIRGMAFSPDNKHIATVEYTDVKVYRYVPEQKPMLEADEDD